MIKKYKWYVLSAVMLLLGEVLLVGGIGIWREYFWQAVENRELHKFFVLISYFAVAALGACLISGYTTYLINYLSLLIRTDLINVAFNKPNFKELLQTEGFEQRIQEDCFNYPCYGLNLLVGMIRNVLVLATFVGIILVKVGSIYLILPALYVILGTGVAFKLAKPLIKLNYLNQCLEAKFRQAIAKLSTLHANSRNNLHRIYKEVFKNNHELFKTTKKLSYFQSFYNQISVIVPYLLVFSIYFSGKITFGVFMQVASSMSHIIDSMSYIINSFSDINNWLSCRKRLKEIGVIK